MPTAAAVAEAIREVVIAQGFRPSGLIEEFDESIDLDRQFRWEGPDIVESQSASENLHNAWEIRLYLALRTAAEMADPDRGRFDAVETTDALLVALQLDNTVRQDAYRVVDTEMTYDAAESIWEILITLEFWNARAIA